MSANTQPEFSRPIDLRHFPEKPQQLVATPEECAALAKRFDLVAVKRLEADIALERDASSVTARGTLSADIVQSCAISADDLPVAIREKLYFRFVPETSAQQAADEEMEISAEDCDEIEYSGSTIDLGEAVAQSLVLAVDPFLEGPNAEEARRKAGLLDEDATGPFAALGALKKKQD